MDMEKLMEHVQIISGQAIAKWCRDDDARLELLAPAMVDKTVIYRIRDKDTFKPLFEAYVKKTGKLHCTKADGMRTMVLNELVELDAPSFRKWYYSLWPKVENTDTSTMSEDLCVALECHNALFANGNTENLTPQGKNRLINDWLKKHYPNIVGRQREHIRSVVKPD